MATTEQLVRLDDEKLGRLYDRACKRCEDGHPINENSGPEDLDGLERTEDGGFVRSGYPCKSCFIAEVKETRARLNSPHRPKGQ